MQGNFAAEPYFGSGLEVFVRFITRSGLFLALFCGCQKPVPPPPPSPPPAVQFVRPETALVTPFEEFGGRAVSSVTVELKARVTGHLKHVHFVDGAEVEAGKLLFEIDDSTYAAELAEAEAVVKQREADVKRLQTNLDRIRKLRANDASSDQEVERLTFETDAAIASRTAAFAARDRAKLDVDFTKVHAPVAGKIGRRLVDEGNLIQADDTSLAVIVSLDPIYAYFDYDERSVLAMRRLVEEGKLQEAPDRNQTVSLALAGEDQYDISGKIDWVDNQIDMGTGTLRARVLVTNERGLLTPGMFVRLRVPLGPEQSSLLIPEQALGTDQGQRFVYVVGPEDEIEYRRVEVGWLQNGKRVISSGLSESDRVVVTGLQRVKAKAKVVAKEWHPGTPDAPVSTDPPAQPSVPTPVQSTTPTNAATPAAKP